MSMSMWIDSSGAPELFPDEEFDRTAYILEVFVNQFPLAKRAIYEMESYSRTRSSRAIYEIRDAFDHLSIAMNRATSPADARRHINETLTHLRRSIVEPIEWQAERKLLEIERRVLGRLWRHRILGLQNCDLQATDLTRDAQNIADSIVEGRMAKASQDSLAHMGQARDAADELLKKTRPGGVRARLFTLLLLVAGLIVQLVTSWLLA